MARPAISDERVIIEGPQFIRIKLKSRWADGTESLLYTPSEFLERLVRSSLRPNSTPHDTMGFSHAARRTGDFFQTNQLISLMSNKTPMLLSQLHPWQAPQTKKQKSHKRKRAPWAQLLKLTFKIDVLKCDKCGGRMKLIGVVFDQPTITTTLRALSLPVRAPSTSEKTQNTHAWFGYPNRPK